MFATSSAFIPGVAVKAFTTFVPSQYTSARSPAAITTPEPDAVFTVSVYAPVQLFVNAHIVDCVAGKTKFRFPVKAPDTVMKPFADSAVVSVTSAVVTVLDTDPTADAVSCAGVITVVEIPVAGLVSVVFVVDVSQLSSWSSVRCHAEIILERLSASVAVESDVRIIAYD